ncbi:VQ motif-containing protein 29-like [Syzygium oleosum]|uniref:VQ motif-containing protein 29-like n=1 Tax=Syzygium oleosum TaxID=219896 RepID=UPI0024BA02C6|nr:VQ motif-containing protein 29-like [Syzygium oleosum]
MERYSAAAAINPHEEAMNIPPQTYQLHRSLHSVPKAPAKPCKKPTPPQPPNPTRVYKVEPINFREIVQKLKGASSQLPLPAHWLQEAAPPPLELWTLNPARGDISSNNNAAAARATTPLSTVYRELMSEGLEKKSPHKFGDGFELSLSPSFIGWSTIPMLSPGTLSGF